jgi:hypothetical protein
MEVKLILRNGFPITGESKFDLPHSIHGWDHLVLDIPTDGYDSCGALYLTQPEINSRTISMLPVESVEQEFLEYKIKSVIYKQDYIQVEFITQKYLDVERLFISKSLYQQLN